MTHVAQLFVDLARLHVHLHVRQADPLVQVFTIVNPADHLLSVAGRYYVKHVWRYVDLCLGLLIVAFVQALNVKDTLKCYTTVLIDDR